MTSPTLTYTLWYCEVRADGTGPFESHALDDEDFLRGDVELDEDTGELAGLSLALLRNLFGSRPVLDPTHGRDTLRVGLEDGRTFDLWVVTGTA